MLWNNLKSFFHKRHRLLVRPLQQGFPDQTDITSGKWRGVITGTVLHHSSLTWIRYA